MQGGIKSLIITAALREMKIFTSQYSLTPVSYTHLIAQETTLDVIPLYVKAGSIIPVGPQVQYATDKPWDHLELKV